MTILVTGATSGIGLATASALAGLGAEVALLGRTMDSAARTAESIDRERPSQARVIPYAADLADQGAIIRLAEDVRRNHPRLDAIVHCAAVVDPPAPVSNGIDTTLAVNHLAPVMLTRLLDRHVAGGRIVMISSSQHGAAGAFDPAVFDPVSAADPARRYVTTKLLNLLFANARVRRPHLTPLEVVDPGFVRTNLGRNARGRLRVILSLTRPIQTAPTIPAALIARRLHAADFEDGGYRGIRGHAHAAANARDEASADLAWSWTEGLLRPAESFPSP